MPLYDKHLNAKCLKLYSQIVKRILHLFDDVYLISLQTKCSFRDIPLKHKLKLILMHKLRVGKIAYNNVAFQAWPRRPTRLNMLMSRKFIIWKLQMKKFKIRKALSTLQIKTKLRWKKLVSIEVDHKNKIYKSFSVGHYFSLKAVNDTVRSEIVNIYSLRITSKL